MERIKKDVVVIGLGAFGSSTLWRLAARGLNVAGVEQYQIAHKLGSTHGSTRTFRIACNEHPGLGAIALKSLELWTELSKTTGQEHVRQIGCLNAGAPDSRPVRGTIEASRAAGVPVEIYTHEELITRFPNHQDVGPDDIGVWDPWAGVAFPERNVAAHVAEATRLGADVYPGTTVTGIEYLEDHVLVHTDTVDFEADQVVITAGVWLQKLVPSLPLTARRVPMYWWQPKTDNDESFELDNFPVFIRQLPEGQILWGHGSGDGFGIKIGMEDLDSHFTDTDAYDIDRHIHESDVAPMSHWIGKAFPGLQERPEKVTVCMYNNSPDELFLVGRIAGSERIIVAGGDSGHGFKHCAGLGELIAQMAAREDLYTNIDFLDPNRFNYSDSEQVASTEEATAR